MPDLHFERLNAKHALAASAVPRAALAVQPNDPSVSTEPVAVTPVGYAQSSTSEDHRQHAPAHSVGQIKNQGAMIVRNEERRKQIDAILDRMLERKQQLKGTKDVFSIERQVDIDRLDLMELERAFDKSNHADADLTGLPLLGSSQSGPDIMERTRVLRKIEAALKRVGSLKIALSSADEQAYTQLLNINVSEAGLAAARAQLGESHFGTIAASSTVDALMSNLRAVVIAAHGRMTPELVRLVFP